MKRTDIKFGEEYLITLAGRSKNDHVHVKGIAVSATKEDTYSPDVDTYPLPQWRGVRIRVTEVLSNPDAGGTSWRSSLPVDKRKPHYKHTVTGMAHAVELNVGEEVVVPAMQILGTQVDVDHQAALRINERKDKEARRARVEQARLDRRRSNLERAEKLGLVDELYSGEGKYERQLSITQVLDLIEADRANR